MEFKADVAVANVDEDVDVDVDVDVDDVAVVVDSDNGVVVVEAVVVDVASVVRFFTIIAVCVIVTVWCR